MLLKVLLQTIKKIPHPTTKNLATFGTIPVAPWILHADMDKHSVLFQETSATVAPPSTETLAGDKTLKVDTNNEPLEKTLVRAMSSCSMASCCSMESDMTDTKSVTDSITDSIPDTDSSAGKHRKKKKLKSGKTKSDKEDDTGDKKEKKKKKKSKKQKQKVTDDDNKLTKTKEPKRPDPEGSSECSFGRLRPQWMNEYERIIYTNERLYSDYGETDEDDEIFKKELERQAAAAKRRSSRTASQTSVAGEIFPFQIGLINSNTMIKYAIIGAELQNIIQTNLRRVNISIIA